MKRKTMGIGVSLLVVMLLGGCSGKGENAISVGREQVPESIVETEQPKETEAPQSLKKENKEYQMQAVNLTELNDMEICIDYVISEYSSLQNFSYKLFEHNTDEDNPVLSPISAYLALSLVGAGAEGDTRKEFQEVLGDMECIPNDLMLQLPREQEGMTISLANSAWVDERMTPDEDWLAWADSVYRSEVFQTKLSTEAAMGDMNQWINKNTQGLIPKLLEQPLEDEARLALFNTIYFKGDWQKGFSKNHTQMLDFSLESGTIEQVEMMQMNEETLQYVKNEVAEGIILPYKDNSMAFVALKPLGDCSVREMCDALEVADINAFLHSSEATLCNLRLPKFEVEFDKVLNDSLQSMGLTHAFVDGAADFSGLGTTDSGMGLYISLVRQKAKVIVDESGTEAAAVTAIVMTECTAVMEPKLPQNIYFDEPFLYMIMDIEREVPLFIGIMDNPNV